MDVTLHIGVHRTGTTSFQNYLRANHANLTARGVGFWGPWRTRNGLLHGVNGRVATPAEAKRGRGRVSMNLASAAKTGMHSLIVSDENLIGTPRRNLRQTQLYPDAEARMARINAGFEPISRIVMQVRSQDRWWSSALSYLLPRGEDVPNTQMLDAIAHSDRGWRHVITDLARACPDAEIIVTPYENFSPHPDRFLALAVGQLKMPKAGVGEYWDNRCPHLPALRETLIERGEFPDLLPDSPGRWQPFTPYQASALREAYADDLYWLRAGADGLATFKEDPKPARPANKQAAGLTERGQTHDRSARKLAPTS